MTRRKTRRRRFAGSAERHLTEAEYNYRRVPRQDDVLRKALADGNCAAAFEEAMVLASVYATGRAHEQDSGREFKIEAGKKAWSTLKMAESAFLETCVRGKHLSGRGRR